MTLGSEQSTASDPRKWSRLAAAMRTAIENGELTPGQGQDFIEPGQASWEA